MKYKIIFLLAFVLIICGNAFSQTKEISFDRLSKSPYEFLVNKSRFRLKILDEQYAIEKYNGRWNVLDTTDAIGAIKLIDFNKDGFLDIIFIDKWSCSAYFFNPNKNTYVYSGEYSYETVDGKDGNFMQMIDKRNNIFYDVTRYKDEVPGSSLFQINDYKKINLARIENLSDSVDVNDNFVTNAVVITQIINNDSEQEIQRIKWNSDKDFDCVSYWKNNWQKFLPKKN